MFPRAMLDRLEQAHSDLGDLSEEHRCLEELVLAAFVRHGGDPGDPRIVRVLTEHLRLQAGEGALVEAHERFEDEVVFPLIRSVLPADPPRPPVEPLSHDLVLAPPGSAPRRQELKRVYAVAGPLVDVHGVTLVVTSVEVWAAAVIVRIGGLPSDESDRRIAEGREALNEWSPESGEPEPVSAWDRFDGLEIALRDDAGTRYRHRRSAVGGTGTEWRIEQGYAPAPPDGAETLYVTAGLRGEPAAFEVPIEL